MILAIQTKDRHLPDKQHNFDKDMWHIVINSVYIYMEPNITIKIDLECHIDYTASYKHSFRIKCPNQIKAFRCRGVEYTLSLADQNKHCAM